MELRKLQKTGGSTLIVSLPKSWANRENLDQGSVVTIKEQKDGSLVLSSGEIEEKKIREIELNADENINRNLIEKYLLGYDILKITSDKNLNKRKKQIKKTLANLVGLEIIDETSTSLTIQYLLDPSEVSIMKSLKRMYMIISVMHKDLLAAIQNLDKKLLKDVIQRDKEVNRLYFLLVRQIRTVIQNPSLQDKEGIKAVDCVDYRLASKLIEQIGDRLSSIAQNILELKKFTNLKNLEKLAKISFDIHNQAAQALFKKDTNLATKIHKLRANLTFNPDKHPELKKISQNLLRIADAGQDLADIVVSE